MVRKPCDPVKRMWGHSLPPLLMPMTGWSYSGISLSLAQLQYASGDWVLNMTYPFQTDRPIHLCFYVRTLFLEESKDFRKYMLTQTGPSETSMLSFNRLSCLSMVCVENCFQRPFTPRRHKGSSRDRVKYQSCEKTPLINQGL